MSKNNWPNWAFTDPATGRGEILLIFVGNPLVACFESAISILLFGNLNHSDEPASRLGIMVNFL